MSQPFESLYRRSFLLFERFGIWALLILIALIRLPFWPGTRALRDGIAYSIGALVTHVAHPPGSIGYCLLGGWVNHFVGNAETSFVYINLIAGLVATYLCYRVALVAGLPLIGSLLAAALYGLSINTLTAALTIAPHLLEGAGTFIVAWFGLLAMQRKHHRFAFGCTLATALVGAMRPTATLFLLAVWLYCVHQSLDTSPRRRWMMLASHIALLISIAAIWTYSNSYYMTQAGYGGTTYEKQVLTVAPYDYVSMSTDVKKTAMRHTFHMPAAEVLAWLEQRLHVRLLPHIPDWPVPSLARAAQLTVQQFIKETTFLIVSIPLIVPIGLMLVIAFTTCRRLLNWQALNSKNWIMLICWFLPAAVFFVIGHMGTLTYLQSNLGAISIACAAVLMPERNRGNSGNSNAISLIMLGFAFAILGGVIFAVGRPIHSSNSRFNLLNVALLQYSGPAKASGYGASRVSGALENDTTDDPTADADYQAANSDAALIEAARKHHFEYLHPQQFASTKSPTP